MYMKRIMNSQQYLAARRKFSFTFGFSIADELKESRSGHRAQILKYEQF